MERENSLNFHTLIITGICGFNLKRGVLFNPSPYITLKVQPGCNYKKLNHHSLKYRTTEVEHTTNPAWKEQFYIQVLESDLLVLEVKVKFDKSRPALRRFLGKVEVPVTEILLRLSTSEYRYTFALSKRNALNATSGSLTFFIADDRSNLFNTSDDRRKHSPPSDRLRNWRSDPPDSDSHQPVQPTSSRVEVSSSEDESLELEDQFSANRTEAETFTENLPITSQSDEITDSVKRSSDVTMTSQVVVAEKQLEDEKLFKLLRYLGEKNSRHQFEQVDVMIPRRDKMSNLGFALVGGASSMNKLLREKGLFVWSITEGSEAELAGLRLYDQILEVDQFQVVNEKVASEIVDTLLTKSGDDVTTGRVVIKVLRRSPANMMKKLKNSCPDLNLILNRNHVTKWSSSEEVNNSQSQSSTANINNTRTFSLVRNFSHSRKAVSRVYSNEDPMLETPSQTNLPAGWEACQDRFGRYFYLDHINRLTQWQRPNSRVTSHTPSASISIRRHHLRPTADNHDKVVATPSVKVVSKVAPLRRSVAVRSMSQRAEQDADYQHLLHRYQSIRRITRPGLLRKKAIADDDSTPTAEEDTSDYDVSDVEDSNPEEDHQRLDAVIEEEIHIDSSVVEEDRNDIPQLKSSNRLTSSNDASSTSTSSHPSFVLNIAYQFLTSIYFEQHLRKNQEAYTIFSTNHTVRYMVKKIISNGKMFGEYQHNKELVRFVNTFAEVNRPLPSGWEKKVATNVNKRSFFVDHNKRMTTFFDPRLPRTDKPRATVTSSTTNGFDRAKNGNRLPVQSPVTTTAPPLVAPRPTSTLTHRSRVIEGQSSTSSNHRRGDDVTTTLSRRREVKNEDSTLTYNDKVVAFLKQENITDIISERYPNITTSESLNYKLKKIRQEGLGALEKFTNSMQLNIMLSLFAEEIATFVVKDHSVLSERPSSSRGESSGSAPRSRPMLRNFNAKLRSFYRKLAEKGYGQGPTKIKLVVNRANLLEDAFRKITSLPRKELQRCKFFVSFVGEEGLDYSGPSREFFFLISRELFNPYYGLFEYSAVDTYTVQISPLSAAFVESPLQWFQFAGRIIGLALIHHCLLDAFFARPLYKMLVRSKCSLSDLRYVDEEFYQSIIWMKENDITELDLDYTVDEDKFGKTETVELRPGGRNIPVTEKNKKDYIDRVIKWRVERGIKEQTNMLIRGFNEVVDLRLVSVFDAKELELVICGTADIDLNDWRKNTEYRGGYHDNHQVIDNFWLAIHKFNNERRLRLLQFVTGTSSVPYEGFSALRGPNGPKKFCIEKWGSPVSLPRAHTCFNRLDLPPYSSFHLLWEKLVIAVEESSTFAIE